MEMLITASIVLYFFSKGVFAKPKAKSVEDQLGEAIAKYLAKGIKTRIEND